jgi:cbb3-type cytochrome oxidase subunit 3
MGQRILATLALGSITLIAVIMMFYGSVMSAFGPGSYQRSNPAITGILTFLVFLVPIICIWSTSKAALIIGGFALLPALVIGFMLLVVPPIGIGLLIPVFIWYGCAYSVWKQPPEYRRRAISASRKDAPFKDRFDY